MELTAITFDAEFFTIFPAAAKEDRCPMLLRLRKTRALMWVLLPHLRVSVLVDIHFASKFLSGFQPAKQQIANVRVVHYKASNHDARCHFDFRESFLAPPIVRKHTEPKRARSTNDGQLRWRDCNWFRNNCNLRMLLFQIRLQDLLLGIPGRMPTDGNPLPATSAMLFASPLLALLASLN